MADTRFQMLFGRLAACVLMSVLLVTAVQGDALHDLYDQALKEAEAGNSVSMYEIGRMLELGVGVEKDWQAALEWYRKAADTGYAPAAYKLGMAYHTGRGVAQDYRAAVDLLTQAGNQGHKKARAMLVNIYTTGAGVPINLETAAYWEQPYQPEAENAMPVEVEESDASAPVEGDQAEPPKVEESSSADEETATPAAATQSESAPEEVESVPEEEVESAPEEVKPVPKEEKANKVKRRTYREQMLYFTWTKGGKPAIGLPSEATQCEEVGRDIECRSKTLFGRQGAQSYRYHVASRISEFNTADSFKLEMKFELEEMLEKDIAAFEETEESGDELTEERIREVLARRSGLYQCDLDREWIATCIASDGKEIKFAPVSN